MKTQFKHGDLVFEPGQIIYYNNIKSRIWTVWKLSNNSQLHECKLCVRHRATRATIVERYEAFTL
jgi:hypothetical protein